MNKNKLLITYSALLLAAMFWGFSFIWSYQLLQFYKPISIVLCRLIIASVFILTVGLFFNRIKLLQKKDIPLVALLAFFEPFMYFIGETHGLQLSSATISAVVVSTIPLFSPIAAWFFFKEKLNILNFIGIIISIIGVFLVIITNDYELKTSTEGILLLILAVFSAIGYSVLIVKLTKRYNIFSIIFYQTVFGMFYFVPVFLVFDYEHFVDVKITFEILKSLLFLAILGSSIAFMLFTYGLRELGIVKANSVANIIPVFTAVFAYFFLGETLLFINIVGILVVLSGLFLSQSQKSFFLKHRLIPFNNLRNKRTKDKKPLQ